LSRKQPEINESNITYQIRWKAETIKKPSTAYRKQLVMPSSFLNLNTHYLHIRPRFHQPFLKLLKGLPREHTTLTHRNKAEQGLAMHILEIHLGGGNIEGIPGPGKNAFHNPPF
jgi:hypothetical protein